MELQNRWVHFRIRDVYIPDPQTLLLELHGDDLLQGKVVDLSDSGMQQNIFAVIEVEGITELLVVPKERVLGTREDGSASEPTR